MRPLAIALVLTLTALAGTADAGETPVPGALRERAMQWGVARSKAVEPCGACHQKGFVVRDFIQGRQLVRRQVKCPDCAGTALRVSPHGVRRARWDFASPARRASKVLPGLEALTRDVEANRATWATTPWKVNDIRMLDAEHAVVVYLGPTPMAQTRWALLPGDTPSSKAWYLFTDEVDGEWPGEVAAAGGGPPKEPPLVPLTPDEVERLSNLLRLSGVKAKFERASRDGETLIVFVSFPRATNEESLDEATQAGVYGLTKAALALDEGDAAVKVVTLAPFRDDYGVVQTLPRDSYTIQREQFGRLVPENLSRDELLRKWDHRENRPRDHVLWLGKPR